MQRGTLWPAILHKAEEARRHGHLQPISTTQEIIEEDGVQFVVRALSNLGKKDEDKQELSGAAHSVPPVNPFLPYDPDLFVADISNNHLVLLNKFSVIDHHILIVTRRFEAQEALLNLADFEAILFCMAEIDGLGFYNAGAAAGASQHHKHFQIVPLRYEKNGLVAPIESLLAAVSMDDLVGTIPALPFVHAFATLDAWRASLPYKPAASAVFECYRALLAAVGLGAIEVDSAAHQSAPYNLLVTREWMLLVPRSKELVEGVAVNALGFAGTFFVRNEAQVQVVHRLGPMAVLQKAAIAAE